MSILPRHTPAAYVAELEQELAAAGITLGPIKPGTRVTRIVEHCDLRWEITYLGGMYDSANWALRGPGVEHGVPVDTAEAVERIAAAALDEDEPGIPGPTLYRGVPVPDGIAANWDGVVAAHWRQGVAAALGGTVQRQDAPRV